jgi:hypothetical protein
MLLFTWALRGTGCTDSSPGTWLCGSLQALLVPIVVELPHSRVATAATTAAGSCCTGKAVRELSAPNVTNTTNSSEDSTFRVKEQTRSKQRLVAMIRSKLSQRVKPF